MNAQKGTFKSVIEKSVIADNFFPTVLKEEGRGCYSASNGGLRFLKTK